MARVMILGKSKIFYFFALTRGNMIKEAMKILFFPFPGLSLRFSTKNRHDKSCQRSVLAPAGCLLGAQTRLEAPCTLSLVPMCLELACDRSEL